MKLGPSGFWIKTAEKFILCCCCVIWYENAFKFNSYAVLKDTATRLLSDLGLRSFVIYLLNSYAAFWYWENESLHIWLRSHYQDGRHACIGRNFQKSSFSDWLNALKLVCTISDHSTRKFLKCDPGLLWPKVKLESWKSAFPVTTVLCDIEMQLAYISLKSSGWGHLLSFRNFEE